ncbi:MAG TPA: glycosyltransferase family 2 protein [Candidatus Acidoferrum sp.]|jgi:glycosyltransferase involved in cell wall biosynthesis
MMKPLVTVLIDTYNHEKYIEQTLLSVLEQGLSEAEMEIVVVDDGSSDRTPAVIEKFGPRVKYVRKRNGGQASAFNAGYVAANGQIIAFLDGDDWWAEGKAAAVLQALESDRGISAVGHGYYEFDETTRRAETHVPAQREVLELTSVASARAALVGWRFLLMGALTVRREVLERIMPIPEEMVFMADSPIQAAAMTMRTLVLEKPLFYYRKHAQNLWAVDGEDTEKLQRKYAMTELVYGLVYKELLDLGVNRQTASALVRGFCFNAIRWRLSRFGGSRREAFRTEMDSFREEFEDASLQYRLFKYLVVGGATLAMPPQYFYRLRNWYAERQVGRHRERLLRRESAT